MKSDNNKYIIGQFASSICRIILLPLILLIGACNNTQELTRTCEEFNRKFAEIATPATNPNPDVMEQNIDLSTQLWDRLGVNGDNEAKQVCATAGVQLDTEPVR